MNCVSELDFFFSGKTNDKCGNSIEILYCVGKQILFTLKVIDNDDDDDEEEEKFTLTQLNSFQCMKYRNTHTNTHTMKMVETRC